MKRRTPVVLHLDADAFFAAVEQLDDPSLAGRAVLVGGLGGRSVVASASREAKARGARSAMPMEQARRRVGPHVVVTPRHDRYREVSRELFGLVRERAGDIQQVSIDEAYLHVPADLDPTDFAAALVAKVHARVGVTVSIGGGTTLLVAKLASTATKVVNGPGSVMVLEPDEELDWLAPQPVEAVPGVGPKTAETLHALGLDTIASLRDASRTLLRRRLGHAATVRLLALANNEGEWDLDLDTRAKQTSHESTFETDLQTLDEIADVVRGQAAEVVADLGTRVARTVTVKLRDTDFTTITRSDTGEATDDVDAITGRALLLAAAAHEALDDAPVRLVGVSLSGFQRHAQLSLGLPSAP